MLLLSKYCTLLISILSCLICSCQSVKYIKTYCGVAEREFKLDYGIYVTKVLVINEKYYDSLPYMVGGIDSLKAKLWYPEIPKRANISGDVVLEYDIDENGNVANLEVISSPWKGYTEKDLETINDKRSIVSIKASTGLDRVVSEAILNTEFIPAIKSGKHVKAGMRITVSFYSQSIFIK